MKKLFTVIMFGGICAVTSAQSFTTGNLALFVASASANNTTASIVEINTTTAAQPAVNIYPIDGTTLPNAMRFSGSATSTGYLSLTNDGSRLCFNGANSATTSGNTNTFLQRGVGTFTQNGTFSLATTYTGVSGDQSRSSTSLNNNNYFIADQGGLYTNGSASPSPGGNFRGIKSFGGTVYVGQSSTTTIQISTVSAPSAGTVTALPGLPANNSFQDFYLVSSGVNAAAFDVLYVISATSNTAGTIEKFSLVSGSWVSNGTYTTTFGGFGVCAAPVSGGADLFVSTGQGALVANSVIKLHDMGGYNTALNINTASNVTLYTSAAGTIIKGVSFAPVTPPTPPTIQFATNTQSVLENAGAANLTLNISGANILPAKVILTTSVYTTATGGGVDYVITNDTITFAASSNAAITVPVAINDDVIPENAEYVAFKLTSFANATIGTGNFHMLYIRDNDYTPPTASNEVMLNLLTSFSNGAEGTNSAEIVAYDSASQKLVIANSIGAKMDIVDFSNPAAPGLVNSINISALGNINSVAVYNSIIAVALENSAPQSNGKILFYDMTGTLISQVDVGAMPDMITFNHAGTRVYAPCEGEPNAAYSLDPEGTIAVVDISGGVATVTNANVTIINFNGYDLQIAALRAAGVRIFGNNGTATVSQDFEPEYITISDNDSVGWVSLQENNAFALVNLVTNTVTDIVPLGTIDYSTGNNAMDLSDQTSAINIINAPVRGMYMPDAITHMNINGINYIFTANEGDARAYNAPNNEESRINGLTLDPTTFPDQNILKSNIFAGRLNSTTKTGDTDNDGDIDVIHVYGGRGFSVWSETGALLYNSGSLLEQIIANDPAFAPMFNATNTNAAISQKNRSDDKGPEIEGVAVANIDGDNLLFASAERLGGVFIFNIDHPVSPRYVGYYNNRNFATNGPDRGAEGIIYINASASPNGNDLLILANEVSSTLSIYQVNTCASASLVSVNVIPNDSVCSGDTIQLNTTIAANTNVQWLENNTVIAGETTGSLDVTQAGLYSIAVSNASLSCADTTAQIQLTILTNPTATILSTDTVACVGEQLTLNATGGTASWNNAITNNVAFTPAATDMYVVTVTDIHGCVDMDSVMITVNSLPSVSFNLTVDSVCTSYAPVNLTGTPSGGSFSGTGVSGNTFNPSAGTGNFMITYSYTDANGCTNTGTDQLVVSGCLDIYNEVTGQLVVYPNPAAEFIYIKSKENALIYLSIYDMNGRMVLSREVSNSQMVDVSSLSKGVYTIQLVMNENVYHNTLIKN